MRTGIAYKKNAFNSAWLWNRAQLAINKKQLFLVTSSPTCWKRDSCFWISQKGQKEEKREFGTKPAGITVTIIFQIACKTFATQCYFTDHLNHETVNKTACRTSSVDPRQI